MCFFSSFFAFFYAFICLFCMKNPQKQFIFTCFPRFSSAVRTHASPYPRLTFFATVFVSTERFLPVFLPLPRAGLFILPFRSNLIRTRRVNLPPNLPVKISRTLSACIFCTSCRFSRRTYYPPPNSSIPPEFRIVIVLFAAFAHRNVLLKPLRRAPFDKQRKFAVFPLPRLPRPSSHTDLLYSRRIAAPHVPPAPFTVYISAKPSCPMHVPPARFFRSSRRAYLSPARCFPRPYAFVFLAINRTPAATPLSRG